jgi:YidC/Oxa1 family membrane protein insertase
MDRRTLLALMLTAIVIVVTPILFPTARGSRPATIDTLAMRDTQPPPSRATGAPAPTEPTRTVRATPTPTQTPIAPTIRPETTEVRTAQAVYRIASAGGTPTSVVLPEYRSLRRGAATEGPVQLLEPGARLFHLHLASATDTIALDTVVFRAAPQRREGGAIVQSFASVTSTPAITLTYRVPTDGYTIQLDGQVAGSAGPHRLLVTMPPRLRSEEADMLEDTRLLSIAYRVGVGEVKNLSFNDLDSLEAKGDSGSIRWVAERNKYFVIALIPSGPDSVFKSVYARAGATSNDVVSNAFATAALPLRSSAFSLRVYAGPQSWNHLRATAADMENVNPYGGFARGLVQPFATIVMRMILWMRETFNVGFGWVLVIFGVLVRIVLWPLNQNAMRSSMKLQRIQPQLAELQKKYKDNPEKQRDAMMKLYAEHGMSPFTPILGCLPMFLPMPILFALYFVFQNTIELRGVSFFWLPDLSLKDPFYITPLFMGVSMYVLSWIGMRGMPPSPQSKMMLYVMPIMFTVMFWNFASGLNLYYAVQNVAALPQQWLLARERTGRGAKAGGAGGGGPPAQPARA